MMLPEDRDRLVRIETKTDELLNKSADQEARLRKCEGFQSWCIGTAAGVSASVTGLMSLIKGIGHG
jgi:hypothetical protein